MTSLIKNVDELKELDKERTNLDGATVFQDQREDGEIIQISPGCYEGGSDGYVRTGEVLYVKYPKDPDAYPELLATFEKPADADHYVALIKACPQIVKVLSHFEKGDAEVIEFLIRYFDNDHSRISVECNEVLHRLHEAAKDMEAET